MLARYLCSKRRFSQTRYIWKLQLSSSISLMSCLSNTTGRVKSERSVKTEVQYLDLSLSMSKEGNHEPCRGLRCEMSGIYVVGPLAADLPEARWRKTQLSADARRGWQNSWWSTADTDTGHASWLKVQRPVSCVHFISTSASSRVLCDSKDDKSVFY